MTSLLLYFALGMLCDVLSTGFSLCVVRSWRYPASAITTCIYLLTLFVYGELLPQPMKAERVALALGAGVGCLLIMTVARIKGKR